MVKKSTKSVGKMRKTKKVRETRKVGQTLRKIHQPVLRGGGVRRCYGDTSHCPFKAELESGYLGYVQNLLPKQIVYYWCKNGHGCVEAGDNNSYYLSCTSMNDSDNHIHIFPEKGFYVYKRGGKHNYGDQHTNGYALVRGTPHCLEEGASFDWTYNDWINFLYQRQCGARKGWGRCKKGGEATAPAAGGGGGGWSRTAAPAAGGGGDGRYAWGSAPQAAAAGGGDGRYAWGSAPQAAAAGGGGGRYAWGSAPSAAGGGGGGYATTAAPAAAGGVGGWGTTAAPAAGASLVRGAEYFDGEKRWVYDGQKWVTSNGSNWFYWDGTKWVMVG